MRNSNEQGKHDFLPEIEPQDRESTVKEAA
jgi:hypothetical protein